MSEHSAQFGICTGRLRHTVRWARLACLAWIMLFQPARGSASPGIAAYPHQADDYRLERNDGRIQARNAAQGFDVDFQAAGFAIGLDCANGRAIKIRFELEGVGRGIVAWRPGKPIEEDLSGNRLVVDHGRFRMEYTNDARGMRHDLVVAYRPPGQGLLQARLVLGEDAVPFQVDADRVVFHQWDGQRMEMVPVLDYSGLVAWDAVGKRLAARMRLSGQVLVLEVDDRGADYPVTIDPISTTPDAVLPGAQAGASHGWAVATAGDVNGDGYSDFLVGAPNYDSPAVDAGQALLYLGSATGVLTTPAWTASGGAAGDLFGYSVSSAGDINGDGYSDVVIGAPGRSSGTGAAYFYLGGPGGLGALHALRTGDAQAGCKFGFSVALAGDVNSDGFSDVVVGAPLYDQASGTDNGKAYLYQGDAGGIGAAASWTAFGATSSGQFGFSVAGAGDLNGDGHGDVVIGAPYQNRISPPIPVIKTGNVFIYQGSLSGLSPTLTASRSGSGTNAEYGYRVSGAGDTNGDGYADLLVGSPGASTGAGRVDLYPGVSGTAMVTATASSTRNGATGERLGASLAMAGDANGDGYGDVLLGSPGYSSNRGRVQLFLGRAAGMDISVVTAPWSRTGTAAGDHLGAALGTAGDVNGDGVSDLVLAAPDKGGMGEATVYHGGTSIPNTSASWSYAGDQNYGHMGHALASAGDVNSDGYADVLIGAPGMDGKKGRAMLFMGSPTGLAATPAWTTYGENLLDQYGFAVASAGDVNGDGYSDVLVGAPSWPNYVWNGKVYLYLGGVGGLAATPAVTMVGANPDDRLGFAVSSAGDVNGDGYSDVALGAYMYGAGTGRAFVHHGSASGVSATPDWTAQGSASSFYAQSISLAGDVNGDGYDDLIVGAPLHDVGGDLNIGAAFVYHGSAMGLSLLPDWTEIGEADGDEFGISVCMAGDVDGNGYSDVVIGAYRNTNGGWNQAGRAYVYRGMPTSGLEAVPNTVIDAPSPFPDAGLGISVCSAGDVNGDGFSDVVVGADRQEFLYSAQGCAQIHLGSASGVSPSPAWIAWGGAVDARLGYSVALAGDVNGDGYGDVLVGAPFQNMGAGYDGSAYLYLGNAAGGMSQRTHQYRSNLSTQVRTSNGTFESACDWGIGQYARSSMGRSKVKLAWEFIGHGPSVPPGVLFPNNSTAYTGQGATWQDSNLSGVLIKQGLTGPTGSSHPAWRVRVRHHPATALDGRPFGRWFVQGIHDLQVPSIKTNLIACGPLPVTLLGATVECVDGHAVLEWSTATEQDCERFQVMRSTDIHHWEPVAVVACSGNSSSILHYRAVDPFPLSDGTTYYRLDQYDINGEQESFPVLPLSACGRRGTLSAWPNPVQDELYVALPGPIAPDSPIQAEVLDMAGRSLVVLPTGHDDGRTVRVPGLGRLPAGSYLVKLQSTMGTLGLVRMVRF